MNRCMYDKIRQTLVEVENNNDINILYAAESGSRGWGFESLDSDYDCRFIYINSKEFYLSIDEGKDYIELPVDKVYDVNGWDLKKALKAIRKSNPTVIEWLNSPIVYIEKEDFKKEIIELCNEYFDETLTIYHYLHIARKKLDEVRDEQSSKLKKYFYILRPLFACCWVMDNKSIPPMEFEPLYKNMELSIQQKEEIDRLLDLKKVSNESELIPRSEVIIAYSEALIIACEQYLKNNRKGSNKDSDKLNKFFIKCLERK
ncbi:DNA polymerase beta superfamily protein [Clostridium manihotivorum]|uniref:Nucleotidyltransferase domain-containing protein n=1 Tax=Clostridium manihotivorum TaxID=2320868 RepID=A0A410DZ15_9CLOT|nr:nucleotidyltransferase domain-containing protein [Clostridium manihotivorum]QAA34295.1 hypothetical protein C1I91_23110 [Clostridium manihotivorum]